MSSLAWTPSILTCALVFALSSVANSQMLLQFPTNFVTRRLWENLERLNRNTMPQPRAIDSLTTDYNEKARTLTTLLPQSRRFLFSPTIQNTITNLNQNSNLQDAQSSEGIDTRPNYAYMNPRTGTMEYDIRSSRPRKICFTFE